MNILIAVHDLTVEKWHLMPWRTVVEVVNGLNALGHNAILLSLDNNNDAEPRAYSSDVFPGGTLAISKQKHLLRSGLASVIELHQIDVVFWPVTWREPRWRTRVIGSQEACKIGWYPGGVYGLGDVLYALRMIGFKKTLAYLVDAIYPKRLQMLFMRKAGVDGLLTMTDYTRRLAIDNGWSEKRAFTVLPGKDVEVRPVQAVGEDITRWLDGDPFFLFMGPPSVIRGVNEVLSAYERVSKMSSNIRLVCLFRSDGYLDREHIDQRIRHMDCKHNIHVTWESLSKDKLNGFIQACHAVIMPFLLVPSEIPLAIIETTDFSKPVLTTTCGGTGEYVANFGTATSVGDVEALAEAMLKLVQNEQYYQDCCDASARVNAKHPDWSQVSQQWGSAAQMTLSDMSPRIQKV